MLNPNIAWGMTAGRQLFHLNASGWTAIPFQAGSTPAQVSAGADGTVCALDTAGNVYQFNGTGWQTSRMVCEK